MCCSLLLCTVYTQFYWLSIIIYYSAYLLFISQVVCMNVYDIAMDFVLLDAFNDLDNPPSTIVAVLQNRWITDGMKKSVRHPIFSSSLLFSFPPLHSTSPFPLLSSLYLKALSAAIWSLLKAKKSMLRVSTHLDSNQHSQHMLRDLQTRGWTLACISTAPLEQGWVYGSLLPSMWDHLPDTGLGIPRHQHHPQRTVSPVQGKKN